MAIFIYHPLCYQRCMYSGMYFFFDEWSKNNEEKRPYYTFPWSYPHEPHVLIEWQPRRVLTWIFSSSYFAIVFRSWRQHFPERYLVHFVFEGKKSVIFPFSPQQPPQENKQHDKKEKKNQMIERLLSTVWWWRGVFSICIEFLFQSKTRRSLLFNREKFCIAKHLLQHVDKKK